eukprot:CAMPEP_0181032100 /NCGR_PEP_ID=MMETSP1070-20121207/6568_1 /TAXON_ID=265543 /ORGANISM="Minutocellus polymorphus, Strain NH13" /LENGTH=335 /DNA_ID=CAMNT_0023109487 /DNA_START=152 /DNA_END=1159 /DNA_ORIENTATION=+
MNSINELASADASSSEDQPTRSSRKTNEGGLPPIRWIQNRLDWRGSDHMPQFCHAHGLGRVATLALILGAVLAVHALIFLQLHLHSRGWITISILDGRHPPLTPERIQLVYQWVLYVVALTAFHTLEFFTTAIYNPAVTSADSFVINQSMAYTTAALVSWIEFWIRFGFFPFVNNVPVSFIGLIFLTSGQIVRALAMITCGESFNHLIQQTKKDNHVLITHGIYKYFRHPSYVGFYYWSSGTQLLLGNPICAVCYSLASWYFFKRRIPFEEGTLLKYFPDEYPAYVASTWSGLPFIWSDIVTAQGDGGTTPRGSNSANHQEVSFSADGFADKKIS